MSRFAETRQLPMQDLYAPTFVSIFVGPNHREFKAPRGLLCSLSAYFRKAFDGDRWAEGQNGSINLPDVQEWIFECFVHWMYTNGLHRQTKNKNGEEHETGVWIRPYRPTDWPYKDLIDIYIFADCYDTAGLRDTVIETIQLKCLEKSPRLPTLEDMAIVFNQLSEKSTLSAFFLDLLICDYDRLKIKSAKDLEVLPPSVLATFGFGHAQWISAKHCGCVYDWNSKCMVEGHIAAKERKELYRLDVRQICRFHEHHTRDPEVSEWLCWQKWEMLGKFHDFVCITGRSVEEDEEDGSGR